jgi:hypothetical protein
VPEAFWQIRVEGFPAVVTMDSHGKSIHADVAAQSEAKFRELVAAQQVKVVRQEYESQHQERIQPLRLVDDLA